ncbi:lipocalin family protein [Flavobacterium sp. FZUC8N2.13]|uniref:Lipocalin family protein n=1 Tax=Flavobacterium zubiriense TaxID=3138075 RepID=A0ABV4TFJ8_9FLAO
MKNFLFVLVLFFSLFSCNQDENNILDNGTYSEVTPVAGRTQINFKSNNSLVIIKSENPDEFNYKINGNSINLSNNSGFTKDFEFVKINENEFKIENLYSSIPESPKTYINFKK